MVAISSQQIEVWLTAFIWPFCRILALLAVAPVLSHNALPARVKVGLALLLSALIAPQLPSPPEVNIASAAGFTLLLQQLVIGLSLGFSMALVFAAIETAGDLIGLQMGLNFATFVDPHSSAPAPLIGSFFNILAMLIFLCVDGHLLLLGAIVESFHAFPIGPDLGRVIDWQKLVYWGTEVFRIGLQLALPLLLAILLTNVALGVLTRSAPQLNLFAVGFPITLTLGFVVLWLSLPHFGPLLEKILAQSTNLLLR